MGILQRMSNIFKAKVNKAMDEIENPIEILDQKIRDMEEALNEARISAAEILGNVHEIEKKIDNSKLNIKEFDEKVKLALSKGNEELAKKALERKLYEEKVFKDLQKSYEEASKKAEIIKSKLKELEEELEKTRRYRDEAAARYNNAKAAEKVNEILLDIKSKTNSISLDEIERKIQRKEAIAEGLEDLRNDSLDKEFEELEKIDLDEELRKYKENLG
ncbi:PspA/IM30 family protein [Caloramator australicus]|uniref:Phage shock protein A n=1 Tax=Caloramator australicus RC3 TaxID=857293 RepID=G0V3V0_9CLOT|nr:PspA/IM30 family protein [Caloramator australicus]CCC57790.1 Phage shock protein A [Caloramator australicus RC3]